MYFIDLTFFSSFSSPLFTNSFACKTNSFACKTNVCCWVNFSFCYSPKKKLQLLFNTYPVIGLGEIEKREWGKRKVEEKWYIFSVWLREKWRRENQNWWVPWLFHFFAQLRRKGDEMVLFFSLSHRTLRPCSPWSFCTTYSCFYWFSSTLFILSSDKSSNLVGAQECLCLINFVCLNFLMFLPFFFFFLFSLIFLRIYYLSLLKCVDRTGYFF